MAEFVGYSKYSFTAKDGNLISGVKLHYTESFNDSKYGVGLRCNNVSVSERVLEGILFSLGLDDINEIIGTKFHSFYYNNYQKVCGVFPCEK